MLRRVIVKSLTIRRRHLAVATAAVVLAATLVTALVTLSLDMKSKAGKELETYGPNLLLLPKVLSLPMGTGELGFGQVATEGYIPVQSLNFIESGQLDGIRGYAPYLYTLATWQGQKVVVVGTWFDKVRELTPYWKVEGEWVHDASGVDSTVIGRNVAERFALHPGDEFWLQFEQGSRNFRVAGVAEAGGSEDNQVFIDLSTAQKLSGRQGQVDLVQIRAPADSLSVIATELEWNIPGIEVKVIAQIAEAEAKVLSKIQLMMGLLTIMVLLTAAVAVFSTITAGVLERTPEIGLMKAIGARRDWIMLLFLAEAWVIGLVAGTIGNVLGIGLAQIIGRSVFGTNLSFRIEAIPVTLATAFLITTLASLWPVRKALAIEPILALRSE